MCRSVVSIQCIILYLASLVTCRNNRNPIERLFSTAKTATQQTTSPVNHASFHHSLRKHWLQTWSGQRDTKPIAIYGYISKPRLLFLE